MNYFRTAIALALAASLLGSLIPGGAMATIGINGGIGNTGTGGSSATPSATGSTITGSTQTSTTPPAGVEVEASETPFGTGTGQTGTAAEGTSTADLAQENECGGSAQGGAFQGIIGELGTRLGGVFESAANRIVRGAGNAADDAINDALGDACGDSSLGQQICGVAGDAIGDIAGDFIDEQGGQIVEGVVGEIGGMFGSGDFDIGSTDFGDIFGGDSGSDIGGITESIGLGDLGGSFGIGGNKVPVDDEATRNKIDKKISETNTIATRIDETTVLINDDTKTLIHKECVGDRVAQTFAQAMMGDAAKNVLENTIPQIIGNPGQYLRDVAIAAQQEHIDEIEDPEIKAQLTHALREQVSGTPPSLNCRTGGAANSLWLQARYRQCGSKNAQFTEEFSAMVQRGRAAKESAEKASTLNYAPIGTCRSRPGLERATIADCPTPGDFQVAVPARDVERQSQEAQQIANRLNEAADEIGETAQRALVDALSDIFTAIGNEAESGLRRLLSDRGSGSSGGGSPLSRLAGGSPSQETGRNYLMQNIKNTLEIEADYQEATNLVIESLDDLVGRFGELRACYGALVASPPAGLTSAQATTAVNNASSTIAGLQDQLDDYEQNLATSIAAVRDLGILLDQAEAARTPEQLNAVAETYDALRNAGRTHTTAELRFYSEEIRRLMPLLVAASADAETQLAQCRGYTS